MRAPDGEPWRAGGNGLLVRVRLTPRASRDAIEGIEATAEGPALRARVRAVPQEGEANAAAARLLAEWLGVAKGAVSIVAGGKSRLKTFAVAGDAETLAARAAVWRAAGSPPTGPAR